METRLARRPGKYLEKGVIVVTFRFLGVEPLAKGHASCENFA
jgi:hypothetical protein